VRSADASISRAVNAPASLNDLAVRLRAGESATANETTIIRQRWAVEAAWVTQ